MGQVWSSSKTHLSHETRVKLYSPRYQVWYYGDSTNKAKGVAIGFDRGVCFSLEDRLFDPKERFLFLKGKLWGVECTLAKIYCPNRGPTNYLGKIVGKLWEFKKGWVMIGKQDSTSHAQGLSNAQLKAIKHQLYQFQLVDEWRIQHPKS